MFFGQTPEAAAAFGGCQRFLQPTRSGFSFGDKTRAGPAKDNGTLMRSTGPGEPERDSSKLGGNDKHPGKQTANEGDPPPARGNDAPSAATTARPDRGGGAFGNDPFNCELGAPGGCSLSALAGPRLNGRIYGGWNFGF